MISDNNAGIDDALLNGVIDSKYTAYDLVDQWTSYGWNVLAVENGNDYDQVVAVLKQMEEWDTTDRRPIAVVGKTTKGGVKIVDDESFVTALLEEEGVAAVHGTAFLYPGHFRISYATDTESLREACTRIQRACAALTAQPPRR